MSIGMTSVTGVFSPATRLRTFLYSMARCLAIKTEVVFTAFSQMANFTTKPADFLFLEKAD
jgi:hypothetical protein